MPTGDKPTATERAVLAADDGRDDSTAVLTTVTGAANGGYAYHRIGADGRPLCGAGGPETDLVRVTIAAARRRNTAPCQRCRQLAETAPDER
jgi:hypothetical protein